MQKIISGTDKQFYDMVIEFHDALFKDKVMNFLFDITLHKDVDMGLFQDFVSLINDIQADWNGAVTVNFNIREA